MSLNHLTNRLDPMSGKIKMGAEEIASKKYFLRSDAGVDTVLFDGSLGGTKYSTTFVGDGLTITASNTSFPTLGGTSNAWSVTSQGGTVYFSMRINLIKADAQTAIVIDMTFDSTILTVPLVNPSDANGDGSIQLNTGGHNSRKVVVGVAASKTIRVNFNSLPSAAGQYDINLFATLKRVVA